MGVHLERYRVEYAQGRGARFNKLGKLACPYGMAEIGARMAWLAGWSDADIELSAKESIE